MGPRALSGDAAYSAEFRGNSARPCETGIRSPNMRRKSTRVVDKRENRPPNQRMPPGGRTHDGRGLSSKSETLLQRHKPARNIKNIRLGDR